MPRTRIKTKPRKKTLAISLAAAVLLLTTAYVPLKKYVFKNNSTTEVHVASNRQIIKVNTEESKSTNTDYSNSDNKEVKNDPTDSSLNENIDKTTDKIEKSSQENNMDNNTNIKDQGSSSENNVDNNVTDKGEEASPENNTDNNVTDKTEETSPENNVDNTVTDKTEETSPENNVDNTVTNKTEETSPENNVDNTVTNKTEETSPENNVDNTVTDKTEEATPENNVDNNSTDKIEETSPTEEENLNNTEVNNNDFSNYDANVFSNSVFFGDSLTEAISYYDYLTDSNVLGIIGLNTISALNHVDSLAQLNPENVFILLGCNDIEGNTSAEWFIGNYTNLIHEIKNKLPNSNIYVQSILPITEEIQNQNSAFSDERVNQFNASINSMADSENINYINLHELLNSLETDYHEPDGIHFRYDFYPKWLSFIQYKIFN